MKRTLVVFGTLLFLSGMFAAEVSAASPAVPEGWPKDIVMGGGPSPVTSHYLISAYFGNLLRKEYGMRSTPIAQSSEQGCLGAARGDQVIGIGVGPIPVWAFRGEEMFAKVGPQKNLRALAVTADLYNAFFTKKKSGIESIADLRGKKLSADYPGAGYTLMLAKEVLAANGLSEDDVIIGTYGQAPEAWNNVASGLADAASGNAPLGIAFVKEFFMKYDGMFIPLSEETIDRVKGKWDWVTGGFIPPGIYRGVDKEVSTLLMRLQFVTNSEQPDDLIYQLAKYMFHEKYRADFERVHRVCGQEILLKRAVTDYTVPFHAGAIKFYKESGVWNQEVDKWQKDQLRKLGVEK